MTYPLIVGIESCICLLMVILFLRYKYKVQAKTDKLQTINVQIEEDKVRLSAIQTDFEKYTKDVNQIEKEIESNEKSIKVSVEKRKHSTLRKSHVEAELQSFVKQVAKARVELDKAEEKFNEVNNNTLALQELSESAKQVKDELAYSSDQLALIKNEIHSKEEERERFSTKLDELMSRVDLYSRLDEYVACGHFEEPEYLFKTSVRFAEEIKRVRQKQKQSIKDKTAIKYPRYISITGDQKADQKILNGQIALMLEAFNIDCDYLIGKVGPSTFPRTLEQIDKLSTKLEKSAATLHCGFNTDYIKLKYDECTLQYQHSLKKQEEQEEQRLIKEQMREEVKAQKEYDRAIAVTDKEEQMYRKMLERARASLEKATEDERIIAEQRIEDLEHQLAEAVVQGERAKSLAEQTRRGHVYIISNVGSFGEGICKIGLTRRLDPLDRVKELGDASVPFKFDIHAIIHAEDAPALEASLHRKFKDKRVNAVNRRKEFFHADLFEVKKAVEEITGQDIDFKMTALADEYYESRRFQPETVVH